MRSTRLEGIVGAGLAVHEYGIKNSLRASQVRLPAPEYVQHNYYLHSGDFLDGFVIAGTANLMLHAAGELLSAAIPGQGFARKLMDKLYDERIIAALSSAAAAGAVILEETRGYFSTADSRDIYAGIAGVAAQLGVRYLAGAISSASRSQDALE